MKIRRKNNTSIFVVIVLLLIITVLAGLLMNKKSEKNQGSKQNQENAKAMQVWLKEQGVKKMLLTPNEYSRPQTILETVTGVVVHYTGNPGTSAEANRNYFESLKNLHTTYASSHFIIGLEGEIIQCLPLTEQSFCNRTRNIDTITIECCHPDEAGQFNEKTYQAVITLVAKICDQYGLSEDQILRHYDITGKICPKYYVDHEDAWLKLKQDVMDINQYNQ